MPSAALQHHRHLALVIKRVGEARTHQRLIVRSQAGGETREKGGVVGLDKRRLPCVIGIVEADADDLGRLSHQGQPGIRRHLHQRPLRFPGVVQQIDASRQQRLQGFAAEDLHPFGMAHAENGLALVEKMDIAHGRDLLSLRVAQRCIPARDGRAGMQWSAAV
ncbi:hypothetical protein D3C80_1263740 [compost metagenome]